MVGLTPMTLKVKTVHSRFFSLDAPYSDGFLSLDESRKRIAVRDV